MPTAPLRPFIDAQETITAQNIVGTDTLLLDTLDFTPVSNAGVNLYHERNHMIQGAGADYVISGKVITWLANTGTAPNMSASDTLVVTYRYRV